MRKRKEEGRRKSGLKKRFMRGAQVADVDKHVAAKRRKQMRKKAESRQSQKRIAKFFKSLFGIVLASILVLFVLSRLFIFDTSVDGAYQAVVDEHFNDSPTQRFKPLLDKDALEGAILDDHPELAEAQVNSPLLSNSISLDIKSRSEVLVWTDFSRARSYIVDANGVAYKLHTGTPRQDLMEIRDRSGIAVSVGDVLVAPSTVRFMSELTEYLSNQGLALAHFVPGDAPQDVRVELNNRSYYLLFTTTRPLLEQVKQLDTFLDSSLSRGVESYIDVRVIDKVFYK